MVTMKPNVHYIDEKPSHLHQGCVLIQQCYKGVVILRGGSSGGASSPPFCRSTCWLQWKAMLVYDILPTECVLMYFQVSCEYAQYLYQHALSERLPIVVCQALACIPLVATHSEAEVAAWRPHRECRIFSEPHLFLLIFQLHSQYIWALCRQQVYFVFAKVICVVLPCAAEEVVWCIDSSKNWDPSTVRLGCSTHTIPVLGTTILDRYTEHEW